MEALGPIRLTEVQNAQKRIIAVARKMSDEGSIVLAGRGGEKCVKMSNLAEEFVTLDKENHVRMRGAIKTAISADFKVEESPKHNSNAGFSKKSIEFLFAKK